MTSEQYNMNPNESNQYVIRLANLGFECSLCQTIHGDIYEPTRIWVLIVWRTFTTGTNRATTRKVTEILVMTSQFVNGSELDKLWQDALDEAKLIAWGNHDHY